MSDASSAAIEKVFALVEKASGVVALLSFVVLFVPDSWLSQAAARLRDAHHAWIWLVFLVALTFTLYAWRRSLGTRVSAWRQQRSVERAIQKKRDDMRRVVDGLDDAQHRILETALRSGGVIYISMTHMIGLSPAEADAAIDRLISLGLLIVEPPDGFRLGSGLGRQLLIPRHHFQTIAELIEEERTKEFRRAAEEKATE